MRDLYKHLLTQPIVSFFKSQAHDGRWRGYRLITHSSLVNVVKIIILYKFVPIEIFQPRSSFLCSERYLGGVGLRVGGGGLRATESPLVANVFGGERIRQLERRRST